MRGPILRRRRERAGARLSPFICVSLLVALTSAGPMLYTGALPAAAAEQIGPIVFASSRGGQFDVWLMHPGGTRYRQLPLTPVDDLPRSWSRDSAGWNPAAGGVASIEYNLPKAGHTRVRVFDAAGHEVARPVDEWQPAGRHQTTFAFGPAPNQVFRYRVECDGRRTTGEISTGP